MTTDDYTQPEHAPDTVMLVAPPQWQELTPGGLLPVPVALLRHPDVDMAAAGLWGALAAMLWRAGAPALWVPRQDLLDELALERSTWGELIEQLVGAGWVNAATRLYQGRTAGTRIALHTEPDKQLQPAVI